MCNVHFKVKKRQELAETRGDNYEFEATVWKQDTDDALEVYDFEDFLDAGAKHFGFLCRFRDFMENHDLECDNDHSKVFTFIEAELERFVATATLITEKWLPKFEKDYDVLHADRLRNALHGAEILAVGPISSNGTTTDD